MQTLESLRSKIESTHSLQSLVHTMKTLAAVNIRQYENAVQTLETYSRHIELAFQIAMRNAPQTFSFARDVQGERTAALVFGSDQGMVGQFNREIAHYTLRTLQKMGVDLQACCVLAIGVRAAGRLEQVGQPVEDFFHVPGSLSGIKRLVDELILRIESWRDKSQTDRILIFHNTPAGGASYRPRHALLFPLDRQWLEQLLVREWESRRLPTHFVDWETLFAALVREVFFIRLYQAAAESLASENASRLASMQAAEKNVEDRLNELNARYHRMRQASITEELLDVVAGFEIITQQS